MASREWVERIAELSLWAAFPEGTRQRVAEAVNEVAHLLELEPGEVLFQEGALGGSAGCILLEGRVCVERAGAPPIRVDAPAILGEMQQFNPQAQRTATVRAEGEAQILKFAWQELYAHAKEALDEGEQSALLDAIEHKVWERFDGEVLADLPLLRGLPDQLRLRICLLLHWIAQPITLHEGEPLFSEQETCGGRGHLLTSGELTLSVRGRMCGTVAAPNVLGVFPDFDPDVAWSATATAKGTVTLLKFNWQHALAMMEQRLSQEEQAQFRRAIEAAKDALFVR